MARTKQPPASQPSTLTVEQMAAAIVKLERRIADLEHFDPTLVTERWSSEVEALEKKINSTLEDVFGSGSSEYREYQVHNIDAGPVYFGETPPLSAVHEYLKSGTKRAIGRLTALKEVVQERLADAKPEDISSRVTGAVAPREPSRRVFVVHGHDDGLKETVARFLHKLDLQPVILHEKPNQGRTIIEKFEAHSDVDFAVVLFTGDDEGYPRGRPEDVKLRARQNVVLELGFFMAKLGRANVCVLHSEALEMPSDYSGVVYIPVDSAGAWRFFLGKEIAASGLQVDLNRAL